jgi:hypothetical protein
VNLNARVKRLERQYHAVQHAPHRLIISYVGGPLDPPEECDLSKATCSRRLWPDGQLMEFVNLGGGRDGLSEDQLEKFIQDFPIERV